MNKKIIPLVCLLFFLMQISVNAMDSREQQTAKQYTQTFRDVPSNHWAFSYISELSERGAINGFPDGTFRPDSSVSRAQFAKIMTVAASLSPVYSTQSSYADVPNTHWCSPFLEASKNYMTGYRSGNQLLFKPDSNALREDIAVAVVALKGYELRNADVGMLQSMFQDYASISKGALPYVAIAVENGLMNGMPDGSFRAQDSITRAEASAILWRAFQQGNDDKVIGTGNHQPVYPSDAKPEVSTPPSTDTNLPETGSRASFVVNTVCKATEPRYITTDKRGDVYYLSNNTIMRFSNGKTESILNGDTDLEQELTTAELMQNLLDNGSDEGQALQENGGAAYALQDETPLYFDVAHLSGLVYEEATDKIYAIAYYDPIPITLKDHSYAQAMSVFEIHAPESTLRTYYFTRIYGSFLTFYMRGASMLLSGNAFIFVGGFGFSEVNLYSLTKSADTLSFYAEVPSIYSPNFFSYGYINDKLHVYTSDNTLHIWSLSTGDYTTKSIRMDPVEGFALDAAIWNNQVYFLTEKGVYRIADFNGTRLTPELYISFADVSVQDHLLLSSWSEMSFDSQGNLLFYDTNNHVIRKISKT